MVDLLHYFAHLWRVAQKTWQILETSSAEIGGLHKNIHLAARLFGRADGAAASRATLRRAKLGIAFQIPL
jgi:hypothetical protein